MLLTCPDILCTCEVALAHLYHLLETLDFLIGKSTMRDVFRLILLPLRYDIAMCMLHVFVCFVCVFLLCRLVTLAIGSFQSVRCVFVWQVAVLLALSPLVIIDR
jgi:hypothetical protein